MSDLISREALMIFAADGEVCRMSELKPTPCKLCGAELRKKVTIRGETVFDHPVNGCRNERLRVRMLSVPDWNNWNRSVQILNGKIFTAPMVSAKR